MAITDWAVNERPREKLITYGAQSLSDAELLAIFLRTGIIGISAVELAQQMLRHFGSLTALVAAPLTEFIQIKGMGEAKFAQLQATVELTRRALIEQLQTQPVFSEPDKLHNYLRLKLAHLPHEVFYVLLLGADLHLLKAIELFRGSVNQAVIFPREIAKLALLNNASAVVVAHNHPQGNATPSSSDINSTIHIKQALELLDIQLLDHIIVAGDHSSSLRDLGML